MRQSFAAAGLVYNPPPEVVPNTTRALCVTELARDRGQHRAVHDRFMQAYWEEGRDIGDPGELRALAADAGLEEDEIEAAMEGGGYHERVLHSTARAHAIGVTGVPAFLLAQRLLVSGAQPRELFEQAVERLADGVGGS